MAGPFLEIIPIKSLQVVYGVRLYGLEEICGPSFELGLVGGESVAEQASSDTIAGIIRSAGA